jgi:hypothetical protein
VNECKPLATGPTKRAAPQRPAAPMTSKKANLATPLTPAAGLTLVHFSAQPEPMLTHNTPYPPPITP